MRRHRTPLGPVSGGRSYSIPKASRWRGSFDWRRGLRRSWMAPVLLALLVACPVQTGAQEMPVPVPIQISLLFRILTFDRAFEPQTPEKLVVGVVYQGRFRASILAKIALEDAVDRGPDPAGGQAVQVVGLNVSETKDIEGLIRRSGVDLIYITPMRAADLDQVASASRSAGILTTTGVPEYMGRGVSVGIGSSGGKPRILIDRDAAVAEGAEFSSELLKLAEIISDPNRP